MPLAALPPTRPCCGPGSPLYDDTRLLRRLPASRGYSQRLAGRPGSPPQASVLGEATPRAIAPHQLRIAATGATALTIRAEMANWQKKRSFRAGAESRSRS